VTDWLDKWLAACSVQRFVPAYVPIYVCVCVCKWRQVLFQPRPVKNEASERVHFSCRAAWALLTLMMYNSLQLHLTWALLWQRLSGGGAHTHKGLFFLRTLFTKGWEGRKRPGALRKERLARSHSIKSNQTLRRTLTPTAVSSLSLWSFTPLLIHSLAIS